MLSRHISGARGVPGLQKGLRPSRSWHSSCQKFGFAHSSRNCPLGLQLIDRHQQVKLSSDCFSEWGTVPSGVPQGKKLGPWQG